MAQKISYEEEGWKHKLIRIIMYTSCMLLRKVGSSSLYNTRKLLNSNEIRMNGYIFAPISHTIFMINMQTDVISLPYELVSNS